MVTIFVNVLHNFFQERLVWIHVHILLEHILQLVIGNLAITIDIEHFKHFPNIVLIEHFLMIDRRLQKFVVVKKTIVV